MNLANVELIPGTVDNAVDPKNLGRIKCTLPTGFDARTMNVADFDWVYPLTMNGAQSFSSMKKGDKVWILNNKDNIKEYWYIPFFELNANTQNVINENKDGDVLFCRDEGGTTSSQVYSAKSGLTQKINGTTLNLSPNGSAGMSSDQGEMQIKNSAVYLGHSDAEYDVAVKGRKLVDLFNGINEGINKLIQVVTLNPYTTGLAAPLIEISTTIDEKLNAILCDNCNVN